MPFLKETEQLLHKSLPALPQVVCNRTLKYDIDDLAAAALHGETLAVVDDMATAEAFGNHIFKALRGRFNAAHITLDAPAADMKTAEALRLKVGRHDAIVAVGSGTINDLCKYASFLDGKPYIIFPTAASMNGYLSANASLSTNGYKKTVAAHMPKALFGDISVIAAAPPRLNKSGLGDSLARSTAQADWLLSHLLIGTPYDETPFELLKPLEPHLHENARGIAAGDPQSLELLVDTLLLSGLGMTIAKGSYPASQGEHMIAHAYRHPRGGGDPTTFHGEEIGVTTLFMAQLQEKLLGKAFKLQPHAFPKEEITGRFGEKTAKDAEKSYAVKQELMEEQVRRFNNNDHQWEAIAARIEPVMVPSAKILAILKAAGCPDTPQALGWNGEAYTAATAYARYLRDRFTFLDLM